MTEWKVITAFTLAVALTALLTTVAFTAYSNSQRNALPSGTYTSYGTNNNGVAPNAPGNFGTENYPANGYSQNRYATQPVLPTPPTTGAAPTTPQTPTTPPTTPNYPQNAYPPYNGYPQNTYPTQPYAPYAPVYPAYGPWSGMEGSREGSYYYPGYGPWGGHE